jgi:very-short-patch-repair endonuclease
MGHQEVPPRNRTFARAMRRQMQPAEIRLWLRLKKPGIEGCRFRRQVPIGPCIVDFFCPEHHLIVELDGDHHGFDAVQVADVRRSRWLEGEGHRVLRFSNREVLENIEGVCDAIFAASQVSRGESS